MPGVTGLEQTVAPASEGGVVTSWVSDVEGGQIAQVITPPGSVIRQWGAHPVITGLLSFLGFFLLWWAVALINGRPVQLPTPIAVLVSLQDLAVDGELFE